jgi:hypothetical protein
MNIKEAIFWIGVALAEASIFVWLDGKHMEAAIILAVVGITAIATSVYLYHRHELRIPGWVGFVGSTQLAVVYDYYDRHHATPHGVMLYITIAVLLSLGYVLYRIGIAFCMRKVDLVQHQWETHLEIVSKNLPAASANELYASLIDVLLINLYNMVPVASKTKPGPSEQEKELLLHPLSDKIFNVPIKQWQGYPVDVYLFQRALNFLRNRLPAFEARLPETNSERTSDEIKAILEDTKGVIVSKANELRKECREKQPTT